MIESSKQQNKGQVEPFENNVGFLSKNVAKKQNKKQTKKNDISRNSTD